MDTPLPIERRPQCLVQVGSGAARATDPGKENSLPDDPIDVSGHVLRARTMTSLHAPNGTFQCAFTYKPANQAANPFGAPFLDERSLNEVLVPENFIDISFNRGIPGSENVGVLQGTISSVQGRNAVGADGTPQREILVSGESWGKLLVNHDILVHKFTSWTQSHLETQTREFARLILAGSVGKVCQDLYTAIFSDQLADAGHGGFTLGLRDVFAFDIDQALFDQSHGYIYSDGAWSRQGKFWNVLRGLSDDPWNELYADWDQQTEKFTIHLRRRPFDKDLWDALPVFTVRDEELHHMETVLADHERYNWVVVPPSGLIRSTTDQNTDFLTYFVARFDQDDAQRNGARLLRRQSAFADMPGGKNGQSLLNDPDEQKRYAAGQGQVFANYDSRAQRLWNWFAINHRLRCGTWVLNGRPEIQIGTRVANQREPSSWFVKTEEERRTFYVERVIHDYVDGRHFLTHLGLTRGQPLDQFLMPATDGRIPGYPVAQAA